MATTKTADVSAQYQAYLDKQLLKKIMPKLQLAQFAKRAPLPGRMGSKTITWHRFADPSTSTIASVSTEGSEPASSEKQLSLTAVTATLAQYFQKITLTDILTATEFFNHTEEAIRAHGQDCALHCDNTIRDHLGSDMTSGSDNKNLVYSNSTWANSNSNPVSADEILDAATALKIDSAPTVDGRNFVGIAPCEVGRDIMRDTDWLDVHKYSSPDGLFDGEIGKLYGVRILETNQGFRSDSGGSQYAYAASGDTYSTFVLGGDAFGVPDLGTQSPFAPKVLIAEGPDKSDPGDLTKVISFKVFYVAKALRQAWISEIYSGTNYS